MLPKLCLIKECSYHYKALTVQGLTGQFSNVWSWLWLSNLTYIMSV